MADFSQAIKWLKEGKKVKCKDEKWFIKFDEDNVVRICDEVSGLQDGLSQELNSQDFEATDWEIYEEDFCLSDKEVELEKNGRVMYWRAHVKEFIKIISNEFIRRFYGSNILSIEYDEFLDFIKKRAGKKLT